MWSASKAGIPHASIHGPSSISTIIVFHHYSEPKQQHHRIYPIAWEVIESLEMNLLHTKLIPCSTEHQGNEVESVGLGLG